MANYKRGYAATNRHRPRRGSEVSKRARLGMKPVRKPANCTYWFEIADSYGTPRHLAWVWLHNWPKYWDILRHRRPRRRRNRLLEHKVLRGADPDDMVWPLGNTRPHSYYW